VDRDQFDNLTRRLFSRGGSRRTLLRLAGTLAVPGLPALGSPSARASAKKTCRRKKHGVYLAKGDCHCGFTCKAPDSDNFHCHSNTDCYCYETVAGTGFVACSEPSQAARATPIARRAKPASSIAIAR